MKLSIIIPIYNAEKYLSTCLESLMKCPDSEVEFILINDGSNDKSEAICEEYAKKDKRFQLYNKENGGVSQARNYGLAKATGMYTMFFDADDYFNVENWEVLMKQVDSQEYDFVGYSYYNLFSDEAVKEEKFDFSEICCDRYDLIQNYLFASSILNTCWGKLFLTNKIKEEKILFRENVKIGEDYIFVADYFKTCKNPVLYNIPLLYYRHHVGSAMSGGSYEDRIKYAKLLFEYNKESVEEIHSEVLKQAMYFYYFKVTTNLFLEFAKKSAFKDLLKQYQKALQEEFLEEIIQNTDQSRLKSYKKIEGILFRIKSIPLLGLYFKFKSRFMK